MAIWDTHPRSSMGIPAPPLHSGPRPSWVSQTLRCCHLGRQGTRAACVMGVGNKDAQDPEPRAPAVPIATIFSLESQCPTVHVSQDCPKPVPELPSTSAPLRRRNPRLSFRDESAFPAQLRAYTPTRPSPQADAHQLHTSRSRLRAERGSLMPATCRPERSETCWFASSTSSPLAVSQNKSGPTRAHLKPSARKAGAGGSHSREDRDAEWRDRGQRAPNEVWKALRFALRHLWLSGARSPMPATPRLDARPARAPSLRSGFPRSVPGVREPEEPGPRP